MIKGSDFQPFAIAGVVAGVATWALAKAIHLIPTTTITFATVDVRSKLALGFGTGLGDKIFSLIGGLQVPNMAIIVATAIAITILGAIVANFISPFAKASVTWRWAWIFFSGSVVGTYILSSFKLGAITGALLPPGVFVLAIFSVIVAWIVAFAYDNIPQLKKQMPTLP